MGGFFGPVGGLVEVPFTSSEQEEPTSRSVYRTSLSGRVTEQVVTSRVRRTWSCDTDVARPSDRQMLEQITDGFFGQGPHVWFSALARTTNVLTPAQSKFQEGAWEGGSIGGAGTASDGTLYTRSITAGLAEQVGLPDLFPVPSGVPVVVSAYVSTHPESPAILYVDEVDPEGVILGSAIFPPSSLVEAHSVSVAAGQHAQRAVVSFTASIRTVALRIRVVGALMVTMPAVTLTREVQQWSTGRGCLSASINMGSRGPLLARESSDGWGSREFSSFTIHELG